MADITLRQTIGQLKRILSDRQFMRDRIGQPGCRMRLEAADDAVALEAAIARLGSAQEPSSAMLDAGVALALNVTVSGQGGWSKYVAELYRTMEAARLRETPIPSAGTQHVGLASGSLDAEQVSSPGTPQQNRGEH